MLTKLCEIAEKAGKAIMEIYESGDFEIDFKKDESPLTLADKASHQIICSEIKSNFKDIPIVSEEDENDASKINFENFFVVDPLDGTKEFIKKNGEFTVNIAYIENGNPVCGVIYVPAKKEFYFAKKGEGAFWQKNNKSRKLNASFPKIKTATMSRSHSSEVEDDLSQKLGIEKKISAGSSLKFCLIADGKAHFYLRKTPLCIWDAAAAYIICEEMNIAILTFDFKKIDFKNILIDGIFAYRKDYFDVEKFNL